jgi:Fe2+ transport system protein FeoA
MLSIFSASRFNRIVPLSSLPVGGSGIVSHIANGDTGRVERLAALGVTLGAPVEVLQTFPGLVFRCDQTELAIERTVAGSVFVDVVQ